MPTLRSLRRSQGLTLVELALRSGIPARTLCAIEQGLQPLDRATGAQLAGALGVPVLHIHVEGQVATPSGGPKVPSVWVRWLAQTLAAALAGALLLSPPLFQPRPAVKWAALRPATGAQATAPAVVPSPPAVSRSVPSAHAVALAQASAPPPPTETATPPGDRTSAAAAGPRGCPLVAGPGHVIITQGYGVGTHAPASVLGGLDLAIDADGDGLDDPGATYGALVVATHGGTARVFLGSWPGGNYVRIEALRAGWSTAYAHLADVAVADGQALAAGTPIGTVGDTGYATGPHLHYEVWQKGQNIDPSGRLACGS